MGGKAHFAVLDGMRGVAAFMVLLLHMTLPAQVLPRAPMAVDFFFMLSGFVVAYAYERRLVEGMGVVRFMRLRLLRLYPLIAIGVLLGLALLSASALLRGYPSPQLVAGAGALGLLLLPCYLFPQWDTAYPLNQALWSLFFELFVNALYALVAPRLSTPRLIALTLASAGVLAGVAAAAGSLGVGNNQDNFGLGFGRVLFPFFAGVLLYRWRLRRRWSPALGAAALIGLAAALALPIPYGPIADLTYVVLLWPAFVAAGAASEVGPKLTAACAWAGRLSYPLYVLHGPILAGIGYVAERLALTRTEQAMVAAGEVVACLAAAWIALKLFDEPIRAALRRAGAGRAPAPA